MQSWSIRRSGQIRTGFSAPVLTTLGHVLGFRVGCMARSPSLCVEQRCANVLTISVDWIVSVAWGVKVDVFHRDFHVLEFRSQGF
jgi:hypothetical protein